jgi:hypothetical protein
MTVKQLLASLDSRELTEWAAFDAIETIGEARADLRAGIVASAAANHGYRDIPKPYKPADFMPFLEHDEDKPVLMRNRNEQSALILRMVFNRE